MKKAVLFFIASMFCVYTAGAKESNIYDDFFKFKIHLYNQEKLEDVKKSIDEYKTSTESKNLIEEEKLILNTLCLLEEISLLKDESGSGQKKNYKMLTAQNEAIAAFMRDKKNSSVNVWLLLSWADIKSRLTSFLSGLDVFTEAMAAKKLYNEVLKRESKFAPCRISYGLWLFFAPPISGGGIENALKEFSKAVNCAKNNSEKYYALCCRSQTYVLLNRKKEAEADLNKAHRLIANEIFTKTINGINQNGKVFFE